MTHIQYITFRTEDFTKLRSFLVETSGQPVKCYLSDCGHNLHFRNKSCELSLKASRDRGLVISRIEMPLPRHGLGTRVLEWLKNYAKSQGLHQVIVENTTTHEINCFCHKHHFQPILTGCMLSGHELYGNYALDLDQDTPPK